MELILTPIIKQLAKKCEGLIARTEAESYQVFVTEADYDLIANNAIVRIGVFQPSFSSIYALYKWEEDLFFVETGMPELTRGAEAVGFKGMDNDEIQAFYLLFVGGVGLGLKETVTSEEVFDSVYTENNRVERVKMEVFERFFPDVFIYKIDGVSIPVPEVVDEFYLKQLSLKYICSVFKESQLSPVKISKEAINLFDKLSEKQDKIIPIDNLVQSILAYRWNFVFLDLYRCIERLYVIGWILDYSQTFDSKLDKSAVHSKLIERAIAHHEDEIIEYLFSLLDGALLSELDVVRDNKNYSDYIYDLRNSIVHYQTNEISQTDEQWDVVVVFLLKAIDKLYSDLAEDIKLLGNKEYRKDKSITTTSS